MNNFPIGIFDSGVGGLSVFKEVRKLLPNEDIIYLADSVNCPYGSKTHNEIIKLSISNTEFLLKNNCKIIVVACNTATAAAIDTLRSNYNIPFIGMEPAIKPAALNTNTGKIGVLATESTFNGKLYKETSKKYAKNVNQIVQIGKGLVELVEQGKANTTEALSIVKSNIDGFIKHGVDQIVLGCTHYPFLIDSIKKLVADHVKIVDPAPAIANRTKQILSELNLQSEPHNTEYRFYSTGSGKVMQQILQSLGLNANINFINLSNI